MSAKSADGPLMIPHGAIQPAELEALGIDPADVIDFSSNVNPYGPSPHVVNAIQSAIAQGETLSRYPDPDSLALRRQISHIHNLPLEQILVGNGSVELLWLLALAFLDSTKRALVLGPTFGEYSHTAELAGAAIEELTASALDSFQFSEGRVANCLAQNSWGIVYLCNPNNPTGTVLPAQTIVEWVTQAPDTLFLVDEAYIDFTPHAQSVIGSGLPNLLVLRSLTKAHALAGLRLGYLVGPAEIVAQLRTICPPWSVNAVAQIAGVVALEDGGFLVQSLAQLRDDCGELRHSLGARGLAVVPTETNYFLVNVGDGAATRSQLLKNGLMVRDCTSFGLPAFIRIATRKPEENERLVETIGRLERS